MKYLLLIMAMTTMACVDVAMTYPVPVVEGYPRSVELVNRCLEAAGEGPTRVNPDVVWVPDGSCNGEPDVLACAVDGQIWLEDRSFEPTLEEYVVAHELMHHTLKDRFQKQSGPAWDHAYMDALNEAHEECGPFSTFVSGMRTE